MYINQEIKSKVSHLGGNGYLEGKDINRTCFTHSREVVWLD